MTYYRFYFLDGTGHIVRAQEFDAADDVAALEAAQKLCGDGAMEVWDGTRCVARIGPDGRAPVGQDRA